MKGNKYKFMTEAQLDEINELINNGHGDALWAFGQECADSYFNGYKSGRMQCYLIVLAGISVGVGAVYLGKKVYHKLKKEEPKPWDKPGRDWEE